MQAWTWTCSLDKRAICMLLPHPASMVQCTIQMTMHSAPPMPSSCTWTVHATESSVACMLTLLLACLQCMLCASESGRHRTAASATSALSHASHMHHARTRAPSTAHVSEHTASLGLLVQAVHSIPTQPAPRMQVPCVWYLQVPGTLLAQPSQA